MRCQSKNGYAEKIFRHCLNTAKICQCIVSNKTSINAYYNHIQLFPQHYIPKILFVVKSVTDILKHPVYVTAHRCAGGLKKLDLRSGSQRHRHFVGFFNVPVLAPTRDHPFYTVIPTHRPI